MHVTISASCMKFLEFTQPSFPKHNHNHNSQLPTPNAHLSPNTSSTHTTHHKTWTPLPPLWNKTSTSRSSATKTSKNYSNSSSTNRRKRGYSKVCFLSSFSPCLALHTLFIPCSPSVNSCFWEQEIIVWVWVYIGFGGMNELMLMCLGL